MDRYKKEIVPIKVKILTKLKNTFEEAMDNIVSYAKYMQNSQRRSKITAKWPREYLMDFMFEESKSKEKRVSTGEKSKERSVSRSPAAHSKRRKHQRKQKSAMLQKMSSTSSQKKPTQQIQTTYTKPKGHAPFNYRKKLNMDADFSVCLIFQSFNIC